MNINNYDILAPFEPPHLDAVTGLAIVKNKLVSGSKDKHVKLWSLDHNINNSKHTLLLFNDYVNSLYSNSSIIKVLSIIPYSTLAPKTVRLRFAIQKMTKSRFYPMF